MFYSFKIKGFRGFTWELLTHPFGKWMMPFNLLLNLIEHLARPVSLGAASVRQPVCRRSRSSCCSRCSAAASQSTTVGGRRRRLGQLLFGAVWACFHILVIPLQAFIFMVLTIVYLVAGARDSSLIVN